MQNNGDFVDLALQYWDGLSEANCVRCYLELLLGGGSYDTPRENQFRFYCWCPAEPNFLSSFFKYILNSPRYMHVQLYHNSMVNSQSTLSVIAVYAVVKFNNNNSNSNNNNNNNIKKHM